MHSCSPPYYDIRCVVARIAVNYLQQQYAAVVQLRHVNTQHVRANKQSDDHDRLALFLENSDKETPTVHPDVTLAEAQEFAHRHMDDKQLLRKQKKRGMLTRQGKQGQGLIEISDELVWGRYTNYGDAMDAESPQAGHAKAQLHSKSIRHTKPEMVATQVRFGSDLTHKAAHGKAKDVWNGYEFVRTERGGVVLNTPNMGFAQNIPPSPPAPSSTPSPTPSHDLVRQLKRRRIEARLGAPTPSTQPGSPAQSEHHEDEAGPSKRRTPPR